MPYRRDVLSVAALSPIAALAGPLSRARADVGDALPPAAPEEAPAPATRRELPAAPPELSGLTLAGGFRVVRAYDVLFGALPFVLEGEGARFQVDVLRRDASGASGAYDSNRFSLFVADGATAFTAPARVRGARALGAALERLAASGGALPALATFEQRQATHPDAAYDVDVDG